MDTEADEPASEETGDKGGGGVLRMLLTGDARIDKSGTTSGEGTSVLVPEDGGAARDSDL